MTGPRIILASGSAARRTMLEGAGLTFEVKPALVDEAALREHMIREDASVSSIAEGLAELKAATVSRRNADALVIGADQILVLGHDVMEKPASVAEARTTLQRLRGQTHSLISAVVLARGDNLLWAYADEARLTMRDFSDAFLEHYLESDDPGLLESVGAYRVEGPGVQLFEKIEGDYFTIMGMPLLPLLDVMRQAGVLAE